MPAAVFVGERVAWPSKTFCQEPGEPPELLPQALAAADTRPLASVCTHLVPVPERLSKVIAPVAVRAPLTRTDPTTPRVVDGVAVPRPTRPSPPRTTRALRVSVELTVVVALMRRVESKVEEAST